MIIAIIIFVVVAITAFLFWASYCIDSRVYVNAVCSVDTDEKRVYLTFDDGPNAEMTPQVLEILAQYGAKAAFFCIGDNITGNEELLRRIVSEGHTIGNHSFTHKWSLPFMAPTQLAGDYRRCAEIIKMVTGKSPVMVRPPFGVTNPNVAKALRMLGEVSVIGWNIRTYDTNGKDLDKILSRVKRGLKPGAVILLHDRLPYSPEVLQSILCLIKEQGFVADLAINVRDNC